MMMTTMRRKRRKTTPRRMGSICVEDNILNVPFII
jgi:hypothetical protein